MRLASSISLPSIVGLKGPSVRRNLFNDSNDLTTATWGKTNGTATGSNTFKEDSSTGLHRLHYAPFVTLPATTYTFSVRIPKTASRRIFMNGLAAMNSRALFDVTTGVVVHNDFGSAQIIDLGTSYRCVITGTGSNTNTTVFIQFSLNGTVISGDVSYTGDNTTSVQFYDLQLEQGNLSPYQNW